MLRTALFVLILFSAADLNLPGLVEVPAERAQGNTMAILYTGDGGWRTTDKGVARILASNGIPVVGINTLRYFWKKRPPEEAAEDFTQILDHYTSAWKKDRVIVIGYSFGADVLPFILNRIPKPLLARIDLLALLAPTRNAEFEFHLRQWFSENQSKTSRPVLPELRKLENLKTLSFCGDQDGEALCRDLSPPFEKVILPKAGHRFDNYYRTIAQDILKKAGQ